MKIRLTKDVLPEQGLVKGMSFDVIKMEGEKALVRSAKGYALLVYPDEYEKVEE